MSPILAARELAKVEGELSSNTTASVQTPSTPPPLDTSKPRSIPITDEDKMSTRQWVEKRRREMAERAR